jgi:hypothetical protein
LRDAFLTFFPDAQWVGDGSNVAIVVCGVRFEFNLELVIDAYSGAFVGVSLRDEEDSTAVIDAWLDAKQTTTVTPPPQARQPHTRDRSRDRSDHANSRDGGECRACCVVARQRK